MLAAASFGYYVQYINEDVLMDQADFMFVAQMHSYDPSVFLQVARDVQACCPVVHSFMSEIKTNMLI